MKTDTRQQNRKKRAVPALILIALITLLTGCSSDPRNFTVNNFTITLTEGFEQSSNKDFDLYLKSDDLVFTAVEETSQELELSGYEINSLRGYCSEIMKLNGVSASALQERNDYFYFTHKETRSGASYQYVHCMYSKGDSYWVCIFACKAKDYSRLEDNIFKWADSVSIK